METRHNEVEQDELDFPEHAGSAGIRKMKHLMRGSSIILEHHTCPMFTHIYMAQSVPLKDRHGSFCLCNRFILRKGPCRTMGIPEDRHRILR